MSESAPAAGAAVTVVRRRTTDDELTARVRCRCPVSSLAVAAGIRTAAAGRGVVRDDLDDGLVVRVDQQHAIGQMHEQKTFCLWRLGRRLVGQRLGRHRIWNLAADLAVERGWGS